MDKVYDVLLELLWNHPNKVVYDLILFMFQDFLEFQNRVTIMGDINAFVHWEIKKILIKVKHCF